MKINLVTLRMRHHAQASGYDRLCDYLDAQIIRPVESWTLGQRIVARSLRFMNSRSGSLWYHRENLLCELYAVKQWCKESNQIFHYLYGENSYRYLGLMKNGPRNNHIVCTYHTPREKFSVVVKDRKAISRVDAVITVSSVQMDFFVRELGHERVRFIPHGIDTAYYCPRKQVTDAESAGHGTLNCLFVGSHLRDPETLAAVAKLMKPHAGKISFTVVTQARYHHHFAALDNVKMPANLSSEGLRQLYQSADLFVMPLVGATANNALLEAMACGLPIVSTDLAGVRDYVNADCAALVPKGDAAGMADLIVDLWRDEARRKTMGRASRQKVQEYSWENIAARVRDLYQELAG